MNFERYTEKTKTAIQQAQSLAIAEQNQFITPLHLFIAMENDEDGLVSQIILSSSGNLELINQEVQARFSRLPKVSGANMQPTLSPDLSRIFVLSERIANKRKDKFITLEVILLGILEEGGELSKIFKDNGINEKSLTAVIDKLRQGKTADTDNAEGGYQALEKFTKNITELTRKGKIDPIIGRDEEIRRTIQILSRRIKNNPVLIGEPGVGKTAIVEGLAQRIVNGDVPESKNHNKYNFIYQAI